MCQPLLIYPFSNSLRYQKHNQGEAPVRTHLTFEGNLAGRSSAVNGKGGILFRFLKSCLFFAVFMLGCTGPSLLGADFLSLRTEGCTPSLCGPLIEVGPPLAEHRPPASGAAAPGFRSTGPQLQERQPLASGAQAPSARAPGAAAPGSGAEAGRLCSVDSAAAPLAGECVPAQGLNLRPPSWPAASQPLSQQGGPLLQFPPLSFWL